LRAEPTGALASALSTPWLLTLTVSHLRHGSPTATRQLLSAEDEHAVQEALFEALIPTAIEGTVSKGPPRHYTAGKIESWLKRLADHTERELEQGRGTEIRMHHLWRMAGAWTPRLLHALLVWLTLGFTTLLAFPLMDDRGLAFTLTVALAFGLAAGLALGFPESQRPSRLVLRTGRKDFLRRRVRSGLTFGFVFGVTAGLGLGAMSGRVMFEVTFTLTLSLAFGLTIGLMYGLTQHGVAPSTPRHVVRDDAIAGLAGGLAAGLTLGLVFGLAGGLTTGLAFGLMYGLGAGLMTGLTIGLLVGAMSVQYLCATLLMGVRGCFPRRAAVFLGWAHRAGLLRVTGAVYQFRHDTYRRWLIARETD
jgi:hypothetical protein